MFKKNIRQKRKKTDFKKKVHFGLQTQELFKGVTTNWSYELHIITEINIDTKPTDQINGLPER